MGNGERFTLGPWMYREDDYMGISVFADGMCVCEVVQPTGTTNNMEANAVLIAQAPKMYALLAELDDLPKDIQGSIKDCVAWVGFRGRVNDVLKKARGEA